MNLLLCLGNCRVCSKLGFSRPLTKKMQQIVSDIPENSEQADW